MSNYDEDVHVNGLWVSPDTPFTLRYKSKKYHLLGDHYQLCIEVEDCLGNKVYLEETNIETLVKIMGDMKAGKKKLSEIKDPYGK